MEDVTQSIHVGVCEAMIADRIRILGKDAVFAVMYPETMFNRVLVVEISLLGQVKGKRNRNALSHESRSPAAFLCAGMAAAAYWMGHFSAENWLPIMNRGDAAALYAFVFLYIAAKGTGIWGVNKD